MEQFTVLLDARQKEDQEGRAVVFPSFGRSCLPRLPLGHRLPSFFTAFTDVVGVMLPRFAVPVREVRHPAVGTLAGTPGSARPCRNLTLGHATATFMPGGLRARIDSAPRTERSSAGASEGR